ncbi:MAG: Wadjet anti-phage system protein JetD domain-containing protein [Phaeodactylibacter xiamenensis]|uniref:Wadjet protein JetD C-terminal domain-containing protein n=1 Tax=Phaeodactylibacter xiamenensis TaxID=1524460 RepID=A0A098S7J1_9BACT|nr:DUF3322 and DUF2220 domain-containing protein [Phaeodactylibacter xiamenensis]KGE87618.1 hypothetical protein IX84_13800 [Phaeodactylibacter xiamenensis]
MITEKAALQQLEKWWPKVLRAGLEQEDYFPRSLSRIGKPKPKEWIENFEQVRSAQEQWLKRSQPYKSKGWSLSWEERDYRSIGRNRFIQSIDVATLEDYLYLLKREQVYAQVMADAAMVSEVIPGLQDWCIASPLDVESHHTQWNELLKVVRYFMEEHRPGQYYIRELPLDIPTKFIETHKRLLISLLDEVLPGSRINDQFRGVRHFEQRYGLKYRQPMVRLRLMDVSLADQYFSGVQDLALPLDALAQLKLTVRRVIILENKTNYTNLMNLLTLPQAKETIGIFGSGFGVGALSEVAWLSEVELFYWGDIDAHGLQILSRLRAHHPHVRPFLMDEETLNTFSAFSRHDAPKSPVGHLPGLTETEQAFFDYLKEYQLRLEQEHIPLDYVKQIFEALF